MKTNCLNLSISLIAILGLASCSPVLYSPVGQNVPLFSEKGQVSLSSSLCSSDVAYMELLEGNYAQGIAIQGAAAIHKRVAVSSSFYSMRGGPDADTDVPISGNGNYWELGAGSFGAFKNPLFRWEIYGGIGFGAIHNKIDTVSLNLNYTSPYIQPSIAMKWKFVEFAITPKMTLVNYTSFKNGFTDRDRREAASDYYRSNQRTFSFEPGFTVRAGAERIKVQFQACYSSRQYSGWDDEPAINRLYTSIGVFCRFGKRQEKRIQLKESL